MPVDTTVTPYDHSTGASRSTTVMGRAVQAASRDLKRQLRAIAAKAFGVTPGKVTVSEGRLVTGEQAMSFTDALACRFGVVAGEIVGRGTMGPEMVRWKTPVLWEVGMGVAELDIDRDTGAAKLVSYVSVADVGKAIHPQHCIGQEEGAAMMGIGHTFMEQMIHDDHQLLNPNLVDYRVPKFEDLPGEFHTFLVENRDGIGPLRQPRHGRGRHLLRGPLGGQRPGPGHRRAYPGPAADPGTSVAGAQEPGVRARTFVSSHACNWVNRKEPVSKSCMKKAYASSSSQSIN